MSEAFVLASEQQDETKDVALLTKVQTALNKLTEENKQLKKQVCDTKVKLGEFEKNLILRTKRVKTLKKDLDSMNNKLEDAYAEKEDVMRERDEIEMELKDIKEAYQNQLEKQSVFEEDYKELQDLKDRSYQEIEALEATIASKD